jgi:hypothetical protein
MLVLALGAEQVLAQDPALARARVLARVQDLVLVPDRAQDRVLVLGQVLVQEVLAWVLDRGQARGQARVKGASDRVMEPAMTAWAQQMVRALVREPSSVTPFCIL